jgi:hypothetical protein
MADLDTKGRSKLADESFAFPKQRKEPIHDAAHVRNALARFNQVSGVSDSEKAAGFARIKRAAAKFGSALRLSPTKNSTVTNSLNETIGGR